MGISQTNRMQISVNVVTGRLELRLKYFDTNCL